MKFDLTPAEFIALVTHNWNLELQKMTALIDNLVASEASEDASNKSLRDAVLALIPLVQTMVKNNADLKAALDAALAAAANGVVLSAADVAAAQAVIDANAADVAATQSVLASLVPVAQAVSDSNAVATPAA